MKENKYYTTFLCTDMEVIALIDFEASSLEEAMEKAPNVVNCHVESWNKKEDSATGEVIVAEVGKCELYVHPCKKLNLRNAIMSSIMH